MHIVAIGWIYVVLMMSITEQSVVAGIMTFLMVGVLPLTIILYLTGGRRRRHHRAAAERRRKESETRGAQSRSESADESEV
jgi:biotin transporter BioY